MRSSYAALWLAADPNTQPGQMTLDEIARAHRISKDALN